MNCQETREQLNASFDTGARTPAEAAAHAAECPACAQHLARLSLLDIDLGALPRAEAPEDLAARIVAKVAEETPVPSPTPGLRWAGAGIIGVAAVVAAWLYPAPWDWVSIWRESAAWFDGEAWRALGAQFAAPITSAWLTAAEQTSAWFALVAPQWVWGLLGAGVAALAIFNGIEAGQLWGLRRPKR